MMLAPRLRPALLLVGLLAPIDAGAQPATPAAAQALEAQLRGWVARQLGQIADASALPLRVVPEADSYRLEIPFGGSFFGDGFKLADGALAATIRPLDGGRWAIVGASMPAQMRAEIRAPGSDAPSVMTVAIDKQATTGVFDPNLATTSSFNTVITGYRTAMESRTGPQTTQVARLTGNAEWQPTTPGRVRLVSDSAIEGYTATTGLPGGTTMQMTIERMGGTTRVDNFDFDGMGEVVRSAITLGLEAQAKANPDPRETRKGAPLDDKAMARDLLAKVVEVLDSMQADYLYEGISVQSEDFAGKLAKVAIGFALGAPDGRADLRLRLAVEGLESPMIPEGVWRDNMPRRVAFSPRVSGVPKGELVAYLRGLIDSEGANSDSGALELLAKGPLLLSIDDLDIDLGAMQLKGAGAIKVVALDDTNGEAELRATGLDAMIRRANTTPDLKMAAPVLIFLKGIGRQEGNETIWKITYIDRKMMVNDTDMSDMMPSR